MCVGVWRLHSRRQSLIDAMLSYVRLVYSGYMTYLCWYGKVQVVIFKEYKAEWKAGRLI